MHGTLIRGLKMILCVGLILLGIGPFGLAQSTDNSGGEETQLSNNKIVQILYDKYRVKYELTDKEFEQQIKKYRVNHNLGYGEILILYALADRIQEATEDEETEIDGTITEILERRADKGWGEIAQDYGLKLGEVISSVMKKEKERNEDTEASGSDHKQGHKNKAKNNNEDHGGGKGKGKGRGNK